MSYYRISVCKDNIASLPSRVPRQDDEDLGASGRLINDVGMILTESEWLKDSGIALRGGPAAWFSLKS